MPRIFISYRKKDSEKISKRLYDSLAIVYDTNQIFFDQKSILPSQDFERKISESIASCDVVIVMIGPHWRYDENGKDYFEKDDDYVLFEIETALKLGCRILIVCTGTAPMPSEDFLPLSLKGLARLHFTILQDDDSFSSIFKKKIKLAIETTDDNNVGLSNYIPQQSSDFLRWLENFESKCSFYQGSYDIDSDFTEDIAQSRQQLEKADSAVKKASEDVAEANKEHKRAESLAMEAREKLSKAESILREQQDARTQATYYAVSQVSPLAEKIRKHDDMSPNRQKEFGIYGRYIRPEPSVVVPSDLHVLVKCTKDFMGRIRGRSDTITWNSNGNPQGTVYQIEASKGYRFHANPVWVEDKFEKIGETDGTEYVYALKEKNLSIPIIYRVKAMYHNLESENSNIFKAIN